MKHQWVMQAIFGLSSDEAQRIRTKGNARPVDLGRQNMKELRGPLCDNCGTLYDLAVVYDKRGNRGETQCPKGNAVSLPAPEVTFGEQRPSDGEPESSVSPDQSGQQENNEGTGVARISERGEMRQLPQRADPDRGTFLLPEGSQPVQQGQSDRARTLEAFARPYGDCPCAGCGSHTGPCQRSAPLPGGACDECLGITRRIVRGAR